MNNFFLKNADLRYLKNADLRYLTSIWSMPLNLYKVLLLFVDGPGKSHCPKVNMIKQIKYKN